MTADIEKFHRTCPILPHHKCWFVVQGRPGEFFVDHVCPFGCSASSGNSGCIAGAAVCIWECEGVKPIKRYEDDFGIFRFPTASTLLPDGSSSWTYSYDRSDAFSRIAPLRVPWHPTKGQDFDFIFKMIGFMWDIPNKTVYLSDAKRAKFLRRCNAFKSSFVNVSSPSCTLRDVLSIHGSLCHIAFVYPDGRSRLPTFSWFITQFEGDEYRRRYVPRPVANDLDWWIALLSSPCIPRSIRSRGAPLDIGLYVDASTDWGVGLIYTGTWDAWHSLPGWRGPFRDIGWLEGVAIELVVLALAEMDVRDALVRVYSDNQGVIGAFDKGRSRNLEVNLTIQRSAVIMNALNIALDLVYIASALNPADPISRGTPPSSVPRHSFKFALPHSLSPYIAHFPPSSPVL